MDIIVPGFSATALSTLRCLVQLKGEGARIFSVGEKHELSPAAYSRIPHRRLICPEGELASFLLAWRSSFPAGRNPLLLLTGDKQVVEISGQRRELESCYEFLLPENPAIGVLMEKTQFYLWASTHGWAVPRTEIIPDAATLRSVEKRIPFPLLIKPYLMHSRRVDNASSLEAFAACLEPVNYHALVVQEWIPGGDDQLYFCYLLFDRSGDLTGTFLGRKLRQYPLFSGSTSLAVSVDDPESLVAKSTALMQSLDMRGFCSVEYKRDARNGNYVIMEPTVGRFNLQVALPWAAGVNFPVALTRILARQTPVCAPWKRGIHWIYETNDLRSFFQGDRKYGYARFFLRPHIGVLYALADPWPLWYEIWARLWKWLFGIRGQKAVLLQKADQASRCQ
jgi:predicted ATP-grasp superfamily ATP-dependent carboligase